MNKCTRPLNDEEFKSMIEIIRNGYQDKNGIIHRGNKQVALAIWLEGTLGLRVGDVCKITLNHFYQQNEGEWYIKIVEQKTKKQRVFLVPTSIKDEIFNYCLDNDIKRSERIIKIGVRAIQKQIQNAAAYLELEDIGTHSSRKRFANNIYQSTNDLFLLSTILNHSNVNITKRYVTINATNIKEALAINACDF